MEFRYRCTECDRHFPITPDLMLCPDCSARQEAGRPLCGVLEVELHGELAAPWPTPATGNRGATGGSTDVAAAGSDAGAENHRAAGGSTGGAAHDRAAPSCAGFLPVPAEHFPPIPVGDTPLWTPQRLRNHLGRPGLFIKDDTCNPTGSLKDRASLLVAAFARMHGIGEIVVASTGNAASSMAGVGAAAGLSVRIFVPKTVPRAKLVQCLQYGAEVEVVDGTYDDAFARSLAHTSRHGGLSRNTGYNPLTIEGKKTVSLEIFAQLGRVPDVVLIPTGDGVILGGVFKGFEDLITLGLASRMPTVIAVQAEGSAAIARALERGGFVSPVPGDTLADSISVGVPANGYGAIRKLAEHSGRCVTVSDDAILDAQHLLSRHSGLFVEPAAAASLAGLLSGDIPSDAVTVLLATGTGLKDIDAASRRLRMPF